jgi:hypothetical protein
MEQWIRRLNRIDAGQARTHPGGWTVSKEEANPLQGNGGNKNQNTSGYCAQETTRL